MFALLHSLVLLSGIKKRQFAKRSVNLTSLALLLVGSVLYMAQTLRGVLWAMPVNGFIIRGLVRPTCG